MMGQRTGGQNRLFYSFNLEDHIPQNNLLRGIDQYLDLTELRQHLADYYSHTGRQGSRQWMALHSTRQPLQPEATGASMKAYG